MKKLALHGLGNRASVEARCFFTSFLGTYLELGYSGLQILGWGLTVKL
jgi:hypothetical protein